MPKQFTWIDDEGWKCCVSQKDRTCAKCGGPVLKGTHYLYYKAHKDAWTEYWCMSCCPEKVAETLELSQTTMRLPWRSTKPVDVPQVNIVNEAAYDPGIFAIVMTPRWIGARTLEDLKPSLTKMLKDVLARNEQDRRNSMIGGSYAGRRM